MMTVYDVARLPVVSGAAVSRGTRGSMLVNPHVWGRVEALGFITGACAPGPGNLSDRGSLGDRGEDFIGHAALELERGRVYPSRVIDPPLTTEPRGAMNERRDQG
jgi:hypothetical protein